MIVEFLVRLHDGTGGRYRGDIVSMKVVPHAGWGRGETLPQYTIVRFDSATKEETDLYFQRHYQMTDGESKTWRARSKYKIDIDNMSLGDKTAAEGGLVEFGSLTSIDSLLVENPLTEVTSTAG